MARYGENFKRLRGSIPQEEIARRLKLKRQPNISAIELGDKVPLAKTILRHAHALGCQPSELLADVQTPYDQIRRGDFDSKEARAAARGRFRSWDGVERRRSKGDRMAAASQ